MMLASIQIAPWDKIYLYSFDSKRQDFRLNDLVVFKTELGIEVGKIIDIKESLPKEEKPLNQEENKLVKTVMRKATTVDLEKILEEDRKDEVLKECKKLIKKHKLEMKLVDVLSSFDGSRITFAFIADGRVDFRELVKDLTRKFNRTIRLQQIGIRDEAKFSGDCGHCGRRLCCRGFLKEFTSITSDMAGEQQCEHRGSDRISGVCGRLMCCLAYEEKTYEELARRLPAIGSKITVDGKKGTVAGHHILKQTIDVKIEDGKDSNQILFDIPWEEKKASN